MFHITFAVALNPQKVSYLHEDRCPGRMYAENAFASSENKYSRLQTTAGKMASNACLEINLKVLSFVWWLIKTLAAPRQRLDLLYDGSSRLHSRSPFHVTTEASASRGNP